MNRGSVFFAIVIALASGAFASVSVMKYVSSVRASAQGLSVAKLEIVIAVKEIPAGTRIASDSLGVLEMLANAVPEGAMKSLKDVVGAVAKSAIYPGEPIMAKRLVQDGEIAGLTSLIPKGHRAITLRVDDIIGVGGFLQPGNTVDVVTTIELNNNDPFIDLPQNMVSKVILQNVKVIATGSELQRDEESKPKVVPTVTVLVTLEQAERLSLAVNAGNISLTLRNLSDQSEELTEGVTLASLIPQANHEVMELPEPEPVYINQEPDVEEPDENVRIVEVYRGIEKSEVTFKQ